MDAQKPISCKSPPQHSSSRKSLHRLCAEMLRCCQICSAHTNRVCSTHVAGPPAGGIHHWHPCSCAIIANCLSRCLLVGQARQGGHQAATKQSAGGAPAELCTHNLRGSHQHSTSSSNPNSLICRSTSVVYCIVLQQPATHRQQTLQRTSLSQCMFCTSRTTLNVP
jgi:hypothetical protein